MGKRVGGPMSTSHMLQAYPKVPTQSKASDCWPLVPPSSKDIGGETAGPCSAGRRAMRVSG